MKSSLASWLGALVLPLAVVTSAPAKPAQPGSAKLTVVYQNWEKFTDVKDHDMPTEKGQQSILNNLREALESDAHNAVPDGDHLTLTFTDIDLAGDFEPWRGPNWDDVRIVKSIYPPRFKFNYQLTDGSGAVVKQGNENIVDMNFDQRLTVDTSDPLRFEKDILREWMERKMRSQN